MPATIEVRIDERMRLAGALLAAGEWPAREQAAKAHKPHRVAEHASRHFAPHARHPAVIGAAQLAGGGAGLGALFGHALNGDWPGDLGPSVEDFSGSARLADFWAEWQADWAQAEADAREVMARADLGQFLVDLIGGEPKARVLAPNLLFPGRHAVVCHSSEAIVVCAPPPQAWGTSPPWRYNERPDEVEAAVCEHFARFLFAQRLPDRAAQAEAFGVAAAVLFLRQAEGEAAGDQFMVMEKKTRGLKNLPALVAALEPILAERPAGGLAGYADRLPPA